MRLLEEKKKENENFPCVEKFLKIKIKLNSSGK